MTARREDRKHVFCPYCEEEILKADSPYCQTCGITIFYCPTCRKPLPRDNKVCPDCGADIREEAAKGSE